MYPISSPIWTGRPFVLRDDSILDPVVRSTHAARSRRRVGTERLRSRPDRHLSCPPVQDMFIPPGQLPCLSLTSWPPGRAPDDVKAYFRRPPWHVSSLASGASQAGPSAASGMEPSEFKPARSTRERPVCRAFAFGLPVRVTGYRCWLTLRTTGFYFGEPWCLGLRCYGNGADVCRDAEQPFDVVG